MTRRAEPETHPSFGMASVNRLTGGASTLFDSDLRHHEIVELTISGATRQRDLSRDWIHPAQTHTVVRMSMAQWGALVSSFGTSGVPVTLHRIGGLPVEPAEHEPRMAESLREVDAAADKYTGKIRAAAAAVQAGFDEKLGRREMAVLLRDLDIAIRNAGPNLTFVAESLSEHVENTVTKARADIEAMVVTAATQRGLDPGSAPEVLGLLGGDPDGD